MEMVRVSSGRSVEKPKYGGEDVQGCGRDTFYFDDILEIWPKVPSASHSFLVDCGDSGVSITSSLSIRVVRAIIKP